MTLTKGQVQETAIQVVESMQAVIISLNEDIGALQTALANATDEIEALRNHIMERDTEIDNLTAALSAEQGKNKALSKTMQNAKS